MKWILRIWYRYVAAYIKKIWEPKSFWYPTPPPTKIYARKNHEGLQRRPTKNKGAFKNWGISCFYGLESCRTMHIVRHCRYFTLINKDICCVMCVYFASFCTLSTQNHQQRKRKKVFFTENTEKSEKLSTCRTRQALL